MMPKSIKLTILLILYVILGASISIILKYVYNEKSKGVPFYHKSFITLLMFFSEIFSLPVYYIKNRKLQKDSIKEDNNKISEDELLIQENEIKQISIKKKMAYIIIASILDYFACFLGDLALAFISQSFARLLNPLALVEIIFLYSWYKARKKKKKIILDQLIGFIISAVAIFIICLSVFYGIISDKKYEGETEGLLRFKLFLISFFMVLFSAIFQSIQNLIEENLVREYNIHQFYCIGFEGIFGFIFNLILCIIFYFIKCDVNTDGNSNNSKTLAHICNKDDINVYRMEDPLFAFEQMFEEKKILYLLIIIIILRIFNKMISISIIKYGGALTRGIIENFRIVIFWAYFVIPWVDESLLERFNWLKLLGVIFTVVSLIFYFNLFKIDERRTIREKIGVLSSFNEIPERNSSINEG